MQFIDKLKFKLMGQSVLIVRASDIDEQGRVGTIELVGRVKKRDNSFIKTWDGTGWEKREGQRPIRIMNDNGVTELGYAVTEHGETVDIYTESREEWDKFTNGGPSDIGKTIIAEITKEQNGTNGVPVASTEKIEKKHTTDLYVERQHGPNLEHVIGYAATMDDIAEAMDLGKSMKNLYIGLFVGIGIGAFFVGPMIQTVLS